MSKRFGVAAEELQRDMTRRLEGLRATQRQNAVPNLPKEKK